VHIKAGTGRLAVSNGLEDEKDNGAGDMYGKLRMTLERMKEKEDHVWGWKKEGEGRSLAVRRVEGWKKEGEGRTFDKRD
jgi:hypothetical protein